jgi:hypothetical protein
MSQPGTDALTVIILVETAKISGQFLPALARVGTLPVLLRTILTVQALQPSRILVCANSANAQTIRGELDRTGRLPKSIEWCETEAETDLSSLLRRVAATNRIVLLLGNRTYQPALLQEAIEWKSTSDALAFSTGRELVGI